MSAVVFIDTSVYLNILNVPDHNQDRPRILAEFKGMTTDCLLLPFATIFETGNHISKLPDGGMRRKFAEAMVNDVYTAEQGYRPYQPIKILLREEFIKWLIEFPGHAMRSKSIEKTKEGGSLSDLTIKKEWEMACDNTLYRRRRVRIWSLDSDLSSCDHHSEKGR